MTLVMINCKTNVFIIISFTLKQHEPHAFKFSKRACTHFSMHSTNIAYLKM